MKTDQFSEEEFRELFSFTLPDTPKYSPTLFDIAGFRHYEEVITNWYSFFFCSDECHQLNSIFINTLCKLVSEATNNNFDFGGSCSAIRELYTQKRGKIDLLLYDFCTCGRYDHAFIIENKIKAKVYNDLNDYYDSIKANFKQGILLTINKQKTNNEHFISITHQELIEAILNNIDSDTLECNEKYVYYLKDFSKNLKQLTKKIDMDESFILYFKNAEKIQKLISLKQQVVNFIDQKVRYVAGLLDLEYENHNNYCYFKKSNNSNLFYTIIIEKLKAGNKSIQIIIEFQNDMIKGVKALNENAELLQLIDKTKLLRGKQDKNYIHFAYKNYNLTDEQIANLDTFVKESIETDFEEVFAFIEQLSNHRNCQ